MSKPQFKHSAVGPIPLDWNVVQLKDVCTKIGSGITPRGGEKVYREKGIALIRSQNVLNNRFSFDGLVYIDESMAKEMENVEVQRQDVLLNITGDSVARCCTVPEEVLPARVNQHVSIIRVNREQVNPVFLRYYLTSPKMQEYMLSLAQSGGTRNALTKGLIEDFVAPQPDISEQEAIADILSKLEMKIALNERMNRSLEAVGAALFRRRFVDFEFPNQEGKPYRSTGGKMVESELGVIPDSWTVGHFSDLVEVFTGKGLSRDRLTDDGKYPVLGANGELGRTNDFLYDEELILTGRVGTLGKVYLINGKVWISDNVLISKPKSANYYHYTYFTLKSFDMEALNRGSTQPLVTQTDLKNQPIIIPDEKTLASFEEILSTLYSKVNLNNQQNKTLSTIRALLLPRLMSGKIRVPLNKEK
ncbi:MAG: restriction endonuclease subunit S [Candidatus Bathyarchaeota archaeon]|nr:restriction endonuclease subunit S [Candidatus Bathyarchaeota archaeon]